MLPTALGAQVTGILGLNTLAPESSDLLPVEGGIAGRIRPSGDGLTPCISSSSYYTFDTLGAAYGLNTLLSAGQNGTGQAIALFELGNPSGPDISYYESCFGLTNPVYAETVDGGATGPTSAEADGDIEDAATGAPGATIVAYDGPNTPTGAYDTWDAIISADSSQVISTSWDQCEPDAYESGTLYSTDTLLKQAAAQGQTVLVAAGDLGSTEV